MIPATILECREPVFYKLKTQSGDIVRCHVNQMRCRLPSEIGHFFSKENMMKPDESHGPRCEVATPDSSSKHKADKIMLF